MRYADDAILHCKSESEAKEVLSKIRERLRSCSPGLNEDKTKIVYCQDYRREKKHYGKKFDFSGFRFQPRSTKSYRGGMFPGHGCAIGPLSTKRIARDWKSQKFHRRMGADLQYLADKFNPQLRGIIHYYGKYRKWELEKSLRVFHFRLAKWVLNKYRRFGRSYKRAYQWIRQVRDSFPNLFYHWSIGFRTM